MITIIIIILVTAFVQGITITYLKQTMFLGYIVLQLLCIYNLCFMYCYYFSREICLYFHISIHVLLLLPLLLLLLKKVKQSHYRSGVAQRVSGS